MDFYRELTGFEAEQKGCTQLLRTQTLLVEKATE
jgi:hypothetical protein